MFSLGCHFSGLAPHSSQTDGFSSFTFCLTYVCMLLTTELVCWFVSTIVELGNVPTNIPTGNVINAGQ